MTSCRGAWKSLAYSVSMTSSHTLRLSIMPPSVDCSAAITSVCALTATGSTSSRRSTARAAAGTGSSSGAWSRGGTACARSPHLPSVVAVGRLDVLVEGGECLAERVMLGTLHEEVAPRDGPGGIREAARAPLENVLHQTERGGVDYDGATRVGVLECAGDVHSIFEGVTDSGEVAGPVGIDDEDVREGDERGHSMGSDPTM